MATDFQLRWQNILLEKSKKNEKELKMDGTYKHLVDAGDANLMEHRIRTAKENKEVL